MKSNFFAHETCRNGWCKAYLESMKISIRPLFTYRNVSRYIVLATAAFLGASCVTEDEEVVPVDTTGAANDIPTAEVVEVEPVEARVGRIMGVGESGRFVVVALDQGVTVETGDTLKARFAGSQTAVLKVSPERQGSLVTADVVAGTPAKDHEVVK